MHLLLGADAGPDSIFRTKELAEYAFGMDFDLKSERSVVERSGHSKAKIFVTVPIAALKREELNNKTVRLCIDSCCQYTQEVAKKFWINL